MGTSTDGRALISTTQEWDNAVQQLRDTNLALLHHEARGLSVRLFRASRKTVTYLGEFDVDRDQPVYQMDASQTENNELRQVLVFKLVPRGRVVREPADNRQLPPGLTGDAMEAVLKGGSPIVALITVEQQHVTRGVAIPPSSPIEVLRREQTLVRDFQDHLETRGSEIKRLEVIPSGAANAIRNDIFDVTRRHIIEAKGSGTRAAVRMALGQILDYSRFAPEAKRAVLLPTRPRVDIEELLLMNGVHAIWRDGAGFSDNSEGDFT
jgi:hypothetical protein